MTISVWLQVWMPGGLALCSTPKFSRNRCYVSVFKKVWYNGNCRQHLNELWHCDTSLFCSLTGVFDGLLVGDRTYACQSFLMTPYPDPETKPQNDFNIALTQTRLKIDMTFAILKARFNCLCYPPQHSHYKEGAGAKWISTPTSWNWPLHTGPSNWKRCQRCNHSRIFHLTFSKSKMTHMFTHIRDTAFHIKTKKKFHILNLCKKKNTSQVVNSYEFL